jgi:DNA-binding NarL/FixJ family response regulator
MQEMPTDPHPSRLLIVDDHPMMRRGLHEFLADELDLEICGEAANMAEGLKLVRELDPDLTIVDISLPDGSGIELIKKIVGRDGSARVLALSMHDEMLYAARVLRAGALGYIQKSRPGDEFLAAIRKVLRGEIALSPEMSDRLLRHAIAAEPGQGSPVESLSDREFEIFEMIGSGLATGEIARRLHLSVKTVESHRENIKRKLRVQSGNELGRLAILWGHGQA